MDLFGTILQDTLATDSAVYYVIERDDNFVSVGDGQQYLMSYDFFPEGERDLLDVAKGDILELASGGGRTSLHLQETGFTVLATDISTGALEVCKERGVRYVKQFDFTNPSQYLFLPDRYETIVIFGNSLPVVGSPKNLIAVLEAMWGITTEDGIVLGDFASPVPVKGEAHLAYHQANRQAGRPIGTINMRLRYHEQVGEWIRFWMPTKEEFLECVSETNWKVDLRGERYCYFILSK